MFRWNLMLRTLFGSPRQLSKARRPRTVKPHLEELTPRILPSASPLPVVSIASPPPVPSVAAITSFVTSVMELRSQFIATIEQDISNALYSVGQVIAQEMSAVEQQVDRILGVNPNVQKTSQNIAVLRPGSDWGVGRGNASGSGSSAATTSHNQPTNSIKQPNGNGSGSSSSNTATSTHNNVSQRGPMTMHPMGSGGGGSGSGSGGQDTYEWDPGVGYEMYGTGSNSGISYLVTTPNNLLAGNPVNWMKNGSRQEVPIPKEPTVPGNKPTDIAILGWGSAGSAGQDPIEWNGNFTFSTLYLTNYTAQETLDSGDTLELTGAAGGLSLSGDANSNLQMNEISGTMKLDGTANWPSFNFTGGANSKVEIAGGTSTILQKSTYTAALGVNLTIDPGATLNDQSYATLNLTASNLVITVSGEMDVYYGTGNGSTLIQQGAGVSGGYIDVNGGLLKYIGATGIKDTLAIPVLVENSGNFTVKSSQGGWLIVKGQVQQTQKYSVYMTSGFVNLSNTTTLECDDDYQQTSGTLQTTDTTECVLQDGANSGGTAVIAGGNVVLAKGGGYGKLDINAANVNFNGQLSLSINGKAANTGSVLYNRNGTITLQKGSSLVVTVDNINQLVNGTWVIIDKASNIIGDFPAGSQTTNPPSSSFSFSPNQPKQGQYQMKH